MKDNVYWEKMTAVATVATLLTSTFVGIFGVYLGYKALNLSADVSSAQMRPLLKADRVWLGEDGHSTFTLMNHGFGPLRIRQSVYVFFDDEGRVAESMVLESGTQAEDVMRFIKLGDFVKDTRVTVGVPAIDGVLGADQKIKVMTISEHQRRSQFFRAQNSESFERVFRRMGICVVYDALDEVRQLLSENGACEALQITRKRFRLRT